jgi:hypothetical protein
LIDKIKAAKKYGQGAILPISFAAFIIYTSLGVNNNHNVDTSVTYVSDSSIHEILGYSIEKIKEVHAVKISKADKVSYYFEYEADHTKVMELLASMPFQLDDNKSSVQCGLMNSDTNPLLYAAALSKVERDASDFFWAAQPTEFVFYECTKSPLKHTMLVSKNSSRILHRVEVI